MYRANDTWNKKNQGAMTCVTKGHVNIFLISFHWGVNPYIAIYPDVGVFMLNFDPIFEFTITFPFSNLILKDMINN